MRTVRVVLENRDEDLIRELGKGKGTGDIDVRMLRRFGFSGARLYILTFGGGLPYVAKIAPLPKYNEERNALRAAGHFFRDGQNLSRKTIKNSGHGGLLYHHAVAPTAADVTTSKELRQIVFATTDESLRLPIQFSNADQDVATILNGAFSLLDTARSEATTGAVRWVSEYRDYARREFSDPTIRCILSRDATKQRMAFLGAEIANPLLIIEQLQRATTKSATFTPVHGDLHPSNVMVSDHGECHLIDFAKARKQAHCLKDYVLMECSLRFMLFPHHVNLEEQLTADTMLLAQDGGEMLANYDGSSELAPLYRRLGRLVQTIRHAASGLITSEWGFHEYVAALFFVLYGNMGFKDYNRGIATRALGLMGNELSRAGFLPG